MLTIRAAGHSRSARDRLAYGCAHVDRLGWPNAGRPPFAQSRVAREGEEPKMRLRSLAVGCFLAVVFVPMAPAAERSVARRPNIVYILADDLGYGDVRASMPRARSPRPILTGSPQRECDSRTPTRARRSALLRATESLPGADNWRSALKSGVLNGYSNRLIEPGRLTVPEFLRQHGYRTACVGKWHLGMDWARKEGDQSRKIDTGWEVDYSGPITNGPLTVGFDDYFGISASLDMPPYLFIRRDRARGFRRSRRPLCEKGPPWPI